MRVVLDTNIFVSILIRPGNTLRALTQILDRQATILYSVDSLTELVAVLRRGKFSRFTSFDEAAELIADIVRTGELVEVNLHLTQSRDASDDKFLSLAVAGHADYLITGDKDLLVLGRIESATIVSPAQFISLMQQHET
jgi:putative PIN family toxin of toxin-antitoxin system